MSHPPQLHHSATSSPVVVAPKPVQPTITHLQTAPALNKLHSDSEIPRSKVFQEQATKFAHSSSEGDPNNEDGHTPSDSSEDLLEYFKNKQSDSYREIQFRIPEEKKLLTKSYYDKRVSFDTVDIRTDEDVQDLWDDVFGWEMYDSFASSNRGRKNELSPRRSSAASAGDRSPIRGYSKRSIDISNYDLSPLDIDKSRLDISRLDALMAQVPPVTYPTRPIVTHRGCTYSKVHKDFEPLYLNKLNNKQNGYLKPVLPSRVILVYLSGRRHTWVALDWILHNFIENGDTVIIVSATNSDMLMNPRRRNSFYTQDTFAPPKTPKARFRMRNKPEYTKFIAKDIMSYVLEVINPNVIAKVTVEIAVGKTKDVLKEMYKLYEPNLVCTGTKPNMSISAPLRSWLSSKLTDRLVKNFPLPVIVVPAVNMTQFEFALQDEINSKNSKAAEQMDYSSSTSSAQSGTDSMTLSEGSNVSSSALGTTNADTDDVSSVSSGTSGSSVMSEESYSSYDEISQLYYDYKKDLATGFRKLRKQPMDESYFANQMKLVSEKSLTLCDDIRSVDPDFRGNGSKLARAITGSNSFGVVPYKTKSMLDPIIKPQSLSYSELKKNLQKKSVTSQTTSPLSTPEPPAIVVEHHDESTPSPRTLKFVDAEVPKSSKGGKGPSLKLLQKSLSHDVDDNYNVRLKLEPLKSHPDMKTVFNTDGISDVSVGKKGKKNKSSKKKSFWKLF
ncbi:uncharacterized protein RJT20DRAFT_37012 [Scheffersomyces xylosifermentans]|uniref:uncharacterized protein n=1 Tax=Scheffersomyces xylosifermentans TaxID=1304137 RepID=UPI00315D0CEB